MGYCCDRPDHTGFGFILFIFEECIGSGDFELGKLLTPISKAWWVVLLGSWKPVVLRVMKTVDAQRKRFQRGTILATNLEPILLIFWQKMWFVFYPCTKNLSETK